MAPERLIRLSLYETRAVIPLATYPAGVFEQPLHIEGNSILSSVFYQAGPGSVKVDYYDTTTGQDVGEIFNLDSHNLVSAPGTDRILVTRVHNKPIAKVTITGGPVTFGLYITVVASFASDLDSALVNDGQTANLLSDKALVAGTYDAVSGQFKFLRSLNGRLLVDSTSSVTTPVIENLSMASNATEYSYPLPAGTRIIDMKTEHARPFKFALTSGGTSVKWVTANYYSNESLDPSTSYTIYVRGVYNNETMQILTWS